MSLLSSIKRDIDAIRERDPAARSAAFLSAAVPLPPAMIAPAWPIRFPGGAVAPAMNAAHGFFVPDAL